MNGLLSIFFVLSVTLASVQLTTPDFTDSSKPLALNRSRTTYAPVAVVELFTSQGCSSCPSADRLLNQTLADALKGNKNIFGLSFHVDYWDRLGWKDPFSQHLFTQRHYQYSEHFRQNGVYTPQEVINGRQEFVGSNRSKQVSALEDALTTPATARIQLGTSTPAAEKITVTYQLAGDFTDAVLNLALVSKTTETAVQRGENAGRKLMHDNVVRVFQRTPAISQGTVTFTLPSNYDSHNGAVIAYVQDRQTLTVRGASMVNL